MRLPGQHIKNTWIEYHGRSASPCCTGIGAPSRGILCSPCQSAEPRGIGLKHSRHVAGRACELIGQDGTKNRSSAFAADRVGQPSNILFAVCSCNEPGTSFHKSGKVSPRPAAPAENIRRPFYPLPLRGGVLGWGRGVRADRVRGFARPTPIPAFPLGGGRSAADARESRAAGRDGRLHFRFSGEVGVEEYVRAFVERPT